jgi:hypothetical protein
MTKEQKLQQQKGLANFIWKEYSLDKQTDFFKHKNGHYLIITKSGIDKIIDKLKIEIKYNFLKVDSDFVAIEVTGFLPGPKHVKSITTTASAKYGGKVKKGDKWVAEGTTDQWYVLEMAEKRANSRVVLRLIEMYDVAKGEDESDEFEERMSDDVENKGKSANNIALDKIGKK